MEIINRKQRMFQVARKYRRENKTVGFVPTMGALHEGHLSLVREARQRCDTVIVSVFVNPAQFNQKDDFDKYRRDLTADAAMLAEYDVDYIFAPDTEEMYGGNFSTYVEVEGLSTTLEGASRPGHFRGVATVVTILLNTVRPDFAFFGQKDAQQVAVIKRLATDLGFDAEIVVMPTVREETGLAMSSRNERLSPDGRTKAAVINKGLVAAQEAFSKGERNASSIAEIVRNELAAVPDMEIDYVAVVDNETLEPLEKLGEKPILIAVAVLFEDVRLIDNTVLGSGQ